MNIVTVLCCALIGLANGQFGARLPAAPPPPSIYRSLRPVARQAEIAVAPPFSAADHTDFRRLRPSNGGSVDSYYDPTFGETAPEEGVFPINHVDEIEGQPPVDPSEPIVTVLEDTEYPNYPYEGSAGETDQPPAVSETELTDVEEAEEDARPTFDEDVPIHPLPRPTSSTYAPPEILEEVPVHHTEPVYVPTRFEATRGPAVHVPVHGANPIAHVEIHEPIATPTPFEEPVDPPKFAIRESVSKAHPEIAVIETTPPIKKVHPSKIAVHKWVPQRKPSVHGKTVQAPVKGGEQIEQAKKTVVETPVKGQVKQIAKVTKVNQEKVRLPIAFPVKGHKESAIKGHVRGSIVKHTFPVKGQHSAKRIPQIKTIQKTIALPTKTVQKAIKTITTPTKTVQKKIKVQYPVKGLVQKQVKPFPSLTKVVQHKIKKVALPTKTTQKKVEIFQPIKNQVQEIKTIVQKVHKVIKSVPLVVKGILHQATKGQHVIKTQVKHEIKGIKHESVKGHLVARTQNKQEIKGIKVPVSGYPEIRTWSAPLPRLPVPFEKIVSYWDHFQRSVQSHGIQGVKGH